MNMILFMTMMMMTLMIDFTWYYDTLVTDTLVQLESKVGGEVPRCMAQLEKEGLLQVAHFYI